MYCLIFIFHFFLLSEQGGIWASTNASCWSDIQYIQSGTKLYNQTKKPPGFSQQDPAGFGGMFLCFPNQNLALFMSTILLLHLAGGSYADSSEVQYVCEVRYSSNLPGNEKSISNSTDQSQASNWNHCAGQDLNDLTSAFGQRPRENRGWDQTQFQRRLTLVLLPASDGTLTRPPLRLSEGGRKEQVQNAKCPSSSSLTFMVFLRISYFCSFMGCLLHEQMLRNGPIERMPFLCIK